MFANGRWRLASGLDPDWPGHLDEALGDIKHQYPCSCRPQTNGKIERVHRTLAFECAYARHYDSEPARAATYRT